MAGSYVNSLFSFLMTCPTPVHSSCVAPVSPHPLQRLSASGFDSSRPSGCEVCLTVDLICIFLVARDAQHLFMCHLWIFFGGKSIQALCLFFNWVVFYNLCNFAFEYLCLWTIFSEFLCKLRSLVLQSVFSLWFPIVALPFVEHTFSI